MREEEINYSLVSMRDALGRPSGARKEQEESFWGQTPTPWERNKNNLKK